MLDFQRLRLFPMNDTVELPVEVELRVVEFSGVFPESMSELGVPSPESQKVALVPAARWRTGWMLMGLAPRPLGVGPTLTKDSNP